MIVRLLARIVRAYRRRFPEPCLPGCDWPKMRCECERLMGWEPDWTLVPDDRGKLLSDGARYRIIGNGVASPVAHWIALRFDLARVDAGEQVRA
jgi:site-specific DNA-cytosine methylase